MTDVLKAQRAPLPPARSIVWNPSPQQLRDLTAEMPTARLTEFDNYDVQTKVVSRSKGSTYVITDHPEQHTDQTLPREVGREVARRQDEYIRERDMVVVDGYIGNDPTRRVRARLYIEAAFANIAGMQHWLYFDNEGQGGEGWDPEVTVIYTPSLDAPGYPDDRLIAVDLDRGVTRVFNSDYFGESKKGGLRMWNKLAYDDGALPLHAGCKVIPTERGEQVLLIVGLSGTGKTTTTFTRQNDSKPVQDDFVALYPGGLIVATENGCFAKTFGLDPRDEPSIHGAVCKPEAYLENVSMGDDGTVDFFDTGYTQNGRAVFRMDALGWHREADEQTRVDQLLILNRNENIIPAVARLRRDQAAAYFMLGETQGTSAGGKEEAGRFLRVPGTNPFFPLRHEQQGNRFVELLDSHPFGVFLLNTGRVGGPPTNPDSKKVSIATSSAVVKAIVEGTIEWETDPDFGYEVAVSLPGVEDIEILQPRRLYERTGRSAEYSAIVDRLRADRRACLAAYPGLRAEIVEAIEA